VLRLLDWLKRIDDNLHKLDTLQESLSLLELVHFEARSLVEYLKQKAIEMQPVSSVFRDVLDGIGYTITTICAAFTRASWWGRWADLAMPVVYGKIVHSHGLLNNCLQQSTITLVQLFRPNTGRFHAVQ